MKQSLYILFFVAIIPLIVATLLALFVDKLNSPFMFMITFMFSMIPSVLLMVGIEMVEVKKLWKRLIK